jgi:hypothetical protein
MVDSSITAISNVVRLLLSEYFPPIRVLTTLVTFTTIDCCSSKFKDIKSDRRPGQYDLLSYHLALVRPDHQPHTSGEFVLRLAYK